MMKKHLLFILFTVFGISSSLFAQGKIITLDLSQPVNPSSIVFTEGGYWDKTYDFNFSTIGFENFSFTHSGMPGYWDGFTVSNNGDTNDYGELGSSGGWIDNQWGCMAGGGIKTDASGAIVKDGSGQVEVEKGIPYLVAYWGFFMEGTGSHSLTATFPSGDTYEAVGVYINNHPWPYYGNIHGDQFAGPMAEGSYFRLLIHSLDENGNETGKSVTHTLAEFKNGSLKQSTDWEWVDLSSLGEVGGFYFTMETSDQDPIYGPNTAVYFCMDKLQVRALDHPEPTVPVTEVALNATERELVVAGTLQLEATVTPSNATNKNVTWSSSNTSVATVDANGLIAALGKGETIITVKTEDGDFEASCAISVVNPTVPVIGVALNITEKELSVSETIQLITTVQPTGATNKDVIWTSSNTAVATVDANGLVKALSVGESTITVTTEDGAKKATCTISVIEQNIPVTGIALNLTEKEINANQTIQLIVTVAPANATNKNVTWTTNNTNVATVNAEGLVTAFAEGEAIITATTEDGKFSATCTIRVAAVVEPVPVTAVKLNKGEAEIYMEETLQLIATVEPADADNKNVRWESSNNEIATVDANGLVKGISEGEAIVTVTTVDGAFTASCTVQVMKKITGIDSPVIAIVKVYPNPVSSQLTIDCNEDDVKQVRITDINGKIFYQNEKSTTSYFSVDVSGWNAGVYFVTVVSSEGVATHKIIRK